MNMDHVRTILDTLGESLKATVVLRRDTPPGVDANISVVVTEDPQGVKWIVECDVDTDDALPGVPAGLYKGAVMVWAYQLEDNPILLHAAGCITTAVLDAFLKRGGPAWTDLALGRHQELEKARISSHMEDMLAKFKG